MPPNSFQPVDRELRGEQFHLFDDDGGMQRRFAGEITAALAGFPDNAETFSAALSSRLQIETVLPPG